VKRIALIMAILLLASIPASAQGTATIQRHVITAGGASSGQLVGAIGQPVAGTVTGPGGMLCSGFWCGDLVSARVGKASLIYSVTFGQIGIVIVLLIWLSIRGGGWLYGVARGG
jgi:hypothetical protein